MNRLKYSKCYLCGPMSYAVDGGLRWREFITPRLRELGVGILNPCDKSSDFIQENEELRQKLASAKNEGRFDEVREIMRKIVRVDLRCVDESSFIIAYLDITVPTYGSIDEIVTACRQKKPTLIVCKQGKKMVPDWIFGIVPPDLFFDNFDDMFKYLRYIDQDENAPHLNRWLFFDHSKVFGTN